ncbi:hypothetical protein UFOVP354_64 [uncultured Caudovirales phage]|uniref:Uncharacterized protein n=1 Tax=uncultured Caudovirales phage TaxID=2100421 RepID=A0A6J5M0T9_9CAUD|nr:hypothetical protein UFOVP354_64 [uncultured Caudovirales phage]
MTVDKTLLSQKLKNNEGLLPWDYGYLPYTFEEHVFICNKALEFLGNETTPEDKEPL